jgi:hypothetical protein
MRLVTLPLVLLAAAMGVAAAAQAAPTAGDSLPPVHAVRLTSPVTVDGALDEAVWQGAPSVTRLTQSDPNEGAAATESTSIWVAYDNEALYVAARCWDSRPDSVIALLVRRDVVTASDRFMVYLDPFHDHRSGYYFGINAAGVLYDGTLFNDGWDDDSWDSVWEGRARRDGAAAGSASKDAARTAAGRAGAQRGAGWTCELKIPYSQLRFRPGTEQVWGINFKRVLGRRNESDYLAFTPRNGSGFCSRFPNLVGLQNGHHSTSVEVLPYMTGKAEYLSPDAGDPFHDGSRYTPGIGGDLRMPVGNSLTLNATVNPDFGQVEVDPAVVNLSDVETYFQEKRPFFTENGRVFGFGNEGANDYWGFNWPEPTFFYTRRVGRAPQASLPDNTEFSDVPVATHILGAAKLTGKLAPSWNFGMMHALTSDETAKYQLGGVPSDMAVEPTTYYGVARAQKEFPQRYNGLGFMTTLAERRFAHDGLDDQLNRQSLMTGLDGWHFLDKKKMWVLSGYAAMSRVAGTPARMVGVQTDPRHYFQRPDASYLGMDSSATSLTGYAARVWLNKQEGNFRSNSAIGVMSPKFDVNDMGFMSRADVINVHNGYGYMWSKPHGWRKYAQLLGAVFGSWDNGWNCVSSGVFGTGRLVFNDNSEIDADLAYNPRSLSNRLTRGGPLTAREPGYQYDASAATDARKTLVYSVNMGGYDIPSTRSITTYVAPAVEWKPVSNFSVQVGPEVDRNVDDDQYVTTTADPGHVPTDFGGNRYVFARLDQTTVSANIRLNVSFTPNLSLQTFIQPLVSSGRYTDIKELARSRTLDFIHYEQKDQGSSVTREDGVVTVNPGAGGTGYWFYDPNFNFKSLRGNAVLRWEYRPGSTFFLVWTQERTNYDLFDGLEFSRSFDRLVTAKPRNIFLTKVTYYWNL